MYYDQLEILNAICTPFRVDVTTNVLRSVAWELQSVLHIQHIDIYRLRWHAGTS